MRKVYRIVGESNTRPENLPAGFQVMESEEPFSADIDSHIGGARISLRQAHGINGAEVVVRLLDHNEEPLEQMFITDDSMRELRDALNDYLGEPERPKPNRVFLDPNDGLWFEVAPDTFIYPLIGRWFNANNDYANGDTGLSFSELNDRYNEDLADVTADYPRP